MSRIALIFTGGTIESVGKDRLDMAWYIENDKHLTNQEVLERIPELDRIATVEEIQFSKLPSHGLVDQDWQELARTIQVLIDQDRADGVVVAHGTNTLEETAFFLHLVLKAKQPVVMVGAMRPASAMSADGDLNLLNAVRVACNPSAIGKGVLVVLNDTIHSARDVTKTATYRVEAFQGRDLGPLGYADGDGEVVFYHESSRPHTLATEFNLDEFEALPRVDLVVSYVGADGALIDAAVAVGAQGIVSAGTGAGRPTPGEDAALQRAREAGVAICIASRVGSGRVMRSPGLAKREFVVSGNLVPWKARILLSLALTKSRDHARIQEMFDKY